MHTHQHGRHEHGQNFLSSPTQIRRVADLAARGEGPIVEIGAGEGALPGPLARIGRPLIAVELDPRLGAELRSRVAGNVTVVTQDVLTYRLPARPHVVVGNLPFHLTTAILRRLLHAPHWTDAHLIVQWEVARRRAGVGGRSLMTSQWEPWFAFTLHGRIPARAFTPSPSVDAGLLTMHRRTPPLLPEERRRAFQSLVHAVYTAPGRGVLRQVEIARPGARGVEGWRSRHGIRRDALARDLPVEAWIDLYELARRHPRGRDARGAADGSRRRHRS